MANVDRPFGARVVQGGVTSAYTARTTRYKADADRSATNGFGNIYVGDFVTLEADGNVAPAASGDTILGVAVAAGPSGDVNHGRAGPYNTNQLDERFLAFDEEGIVDVVDDPNILIEIQEAGDDLDESDVGSTFDITATAGEAHGSDLSGESTVEIDGSASVNDDLVVVGLVDREDNEVGENAKWLVRINNHQWA